MPGGSQDPQRAYFSSEEQDPDQLFKAIASDIDIIRCQLKVHKLRKSSPSRGALERIYAILKQRFPGLHDVPPHMSAWPVGWWHQDTFCMRYTLCNAVRRIRGPLNSTAFDELQTLGDYIVKWYAPEGLDSAAGIYRRILDQLDSESPISQDPRRPHVVKELAKIYLDPAVSHGCHKGRHSIILQGLSEMKKGDRYELTQFYQNLGALYVSHHGTNMELQGRETLGEEILRRTYLTQTHFFGPDDYRSVKTVDILSRYYSRVGREAEAASLLESVLLRKETLKNALGREGIHIGQIYDRDEDEDDDQDDEYEGAGGEQKRRALKYWKDSITDAVSGDNFYSRLRSLMAPPSYLWKDHRSYLREIEEFRWQSIAVTDALENYPVCMVFRNGEVQVRVPMASLFDNGEGNAEVAALIKSVEESRFFQLLKTGAPVEVDVHADLRAAQEKHMKQVADLRNAMMAEYEPRPGPFTTRMEDSKVLDKKEPDLTIPDVDHIIWGFPRELIAPNWEASQDQVILGDAPLEHTQVHMAYKLHKLPDRQEWLVSVTDPREARDSYQMFGHGEPFQYLGRSRPRSVPRIDNPAQTWLQSNNDLEYSIQEKRNDTTINLVCPYISYAGLQELKGFGLGFKYVDFMQQLRLSRRHPEEAEAILGFKKALCRYPDLAVTKPPVITVKPAPKHISAELVSNETKGSQNHHESAGFFNHIPGLSIVAQHENIWQGFNLVSSTWSDWETFAINKDLPENAYPKLQSQAGDPINCHGAIRGHWALNSLTGSYLVEAVFVVDAVFTCIEKPGVQFDFVFSTETLEETSKTQLNAAEKRLLMGALNPSFFTYKDPREGPPVGAAWFKSDKTSKTQVAKERTLDQEVMIKAEEKRAYERELEEKRQLCKDEPLKLGELEEEYKRRLKAWEDFDERLATAKKDLETMPL